MRSTPCLFSLEALLHETFCHKQCTQAESKRHRYGVSVVFGGLWFLETIVLLILCFGLGCTYLDLGRGGCICKRRLSSWKIFVYMSMMNCLYNEIILRVQVNIYIVKYKYGYESLPLFNYMYIKTKLRNNGGISD